jgi:lambda family phage portal protein
LTSLEPTGSELRGHFLTTMFDKFKQQALVAARKALAKYDGATQGRGVGRKGWHAPASGPNTELRMSAEALRNRSRDLARNNHIARQALRTITNGVIGNGIIPHVSIDSSGIGQPTAGDKLRAREIESLLKHHFDTPMIDATGQMDLYSLQDLALYSSLESGDVIVVREWRSSASMRSEGLALPFQLRVLESDYLAKELESFVLPNGTENQIVQGVEVDNYGRPVAYHLYESHPGEYAYWHQMKTRRVSADDAILLYEILRPGQVRGVPELAPVMMDVKDIADFEIAELKRQEMAACFMAFVTKTLDAGAADREQYDLAPGLVWELSPGEDVRLSSPPQSNGYVDYIRTKYRGVAAGVGITYEALTQDFSQVNYSSSRMAHLSMHANFDRKRNRVMRSQLCTKLQAWTNEALEMMGFDSSDVIWTWNAPRRPMLDPAKETSAYAAMVRSGFRDRDSIILELGEDPETVDTRNKISFERADELGVRYDTDGRKMTQYGQPIEEI